MTDELMSELKTTPEASSNITVMGVGGAGGNAVNHMWDIGIHNVHFMVCNTDQQALDQSPVPTKICLGKNGHGAGNDPENGRAAAVESLEEVRAQLEATGTEMLFITAGMGGGTGTGASPVIAKLAREMGMLTVAIVTSPLAVEGVLRYNQAIRGIEELRKNVDSVLIINNDSILELYGDLSLADAFKKADDILASAAKGIAEIITVKSDLVNVDFADVKNVMSNTGRIHMAVVQAEGEDRALKAAEASLHSPLLDHNQISGAKNILINISIAQTSDLKASELRTILEYIQSHASVKSATGVIQNANIIWGTSPNPQLGEALQLMIVATGFDEEKDKPILPDRSISPAEPEGERPAGLAGGLSPLKPRAAAPRPAEPIVLGEKSTRYKDINHVKAQPAYKTRNSKFVMEASGMHKETIQPESEEEAPKSQGESHLPFSSN